MRCLHSAVRVLVEVDAIDELGRSCAHKGAARGVVLKGRGADLLRRHLLWGLPRCQRLVGSGRWNGRSHQKP